MIVLGLTGSIGMGKSVTAQIFRGLGLPVHDADAAVHDLYQGAAAPLIEAAFPGAVSNGVVDRQILAQKVLNNPEALKTLEAIVHPLVAQNRDDFLALCEKNNVAAAVLDIPLLFETGSESLVDRIVVVTAPGDVQRARVLARPHMTPERFETILAKQMPDDQKRAKADFIVDTSRGVAFARQQVQDILRQIGLNQHHA